MTSYDRAHGKHQTNTVGYDAKGRKVIIFVTCPRAFLGPHAVGAGGLVRWKQAGYPDGIVFVNGWVWILFPDPGCEL